MTMTTGPSSFAYSRIFAQGWNAARRSPLTGGAEAQKVAAKNPYKTAHERARWDEGFAKGME